MERSGLGAVRVQLRDAMTDDLILFFSSASASTFLDLAKPHFFANLTHNIFGIPKSPHLEFGVYLQRSCR